MSDSIAVVDATNVNQSLSPPPPPQLFKLNVDCFEHLFEWMSLKELLVFRRTCKRMKAVVDYYIKLTYPQILRLRIYNRRRWMDLHSEHLNYFEWIKQLSIDPMGVRLIINPNDPAIESIVYILNRLEVLKLHNVRIDGDFYDVILRHCPLLKHLNITSSLRSNSIIGTGSKWLFRQYQSMEHFEMHLPSSRFMNAAQYTTELVEFFIQNPQIRVFSTDSDFLERSYRKLLESQIQFDRLDIYVVGWLNTVRDLAKILYENQFYKQLHLYNNKLHLIENEAHCLSAFGNLEKLHLSSIPLSSVPVVESIKELSIDYFDRVPMDILALLPIQVDIANIIGENFINLRRIDMRYAHMDNIRSFICHAPKLQQIRVVGIFHSPTISDFKEMNDERKKLIGASKVKILIGEQDFLKLKWKGNVNFDLIELKRTDMYNVDHEYHWM